MQINVTTDYAIRVVLYLAVKNSITPSSEIASTMGIPKSYILKITNKLQDAGIAERIVGARGGFMLTKNPEKINLYEILKIMEPTMKINYCLEDDEYCSRFATDNCPIRNFYTRLQNELESKLQEITVKMLIG